MNVIIIIMNEPSSYLGDNNNLHKDKNKRRSSALSSNHPQDIEIGISRESQLSPNFNNDRSSSIRVGSNGSDQLLNARMAREIRQINQNDNSSRGSNSSFRVNGNPAVNVAFNETEKTKQKVQINVQNSFFLGNLSPSQQIEMIREQQIAQSSAQFFQNGISNHQNVESGGGNASSSEEDRELIQEYRNYGNRRASKKAQSVVPSAIKQSVRQQLSMNSELFRPPSMHNVAMFVEGMEEAKLAFDSVKEQSVEHIESNNHPILEEEEEEKKQQKPSVIRERSLSVVNVRHKMSGVENQQNQANSVIQRMSALRDSHNQDDLKSIQRRFSKSKFPFYEMMFKLNSKQNESKRIIKKSSEIDLNNPSSNNIPLDISGKKSLKSINFTNEEKNQMELMKKFMQIKQRIDGINDTLYVCYYASTNGLSYRKLIPPEESKVDQDNLSLNSSFIEDSVDEFPNKADVSKQNMSINLQKDNISESLLSINGMRTPRKMQERSLTPKISGAKPNMMADDDDYENIPSKPKRRSNSMKIGKPQLKLLDEVKGYINKEIRHKQMEGKIGTFKNLINRKEVYRQLSDTKKRNIRGNIGPKKINQFDRQQINNFVEKCQKHNLQNIKMGKIRINSFLKGVIENNKLGVVQEEDGSSMNPKSSKALSSFNISSNLRKIHNSISGRLLGEVQSLSYQVAARNFDGKSSIHLSAIEGMMQPSQSGISKPASNSKSSSSQSQSMSSKKRPVIIVCKNTEGKLVTPNPRQVDIILAKIKAEKKKHADNVCHVLIQGNDIKLQNTVEEENSDASSINASLDDDNKSDFSRSSIKSKKFDVSSISGRKRRLSKNSHKSLNDITKRRSQKLIIAAEQSARGLQSNRKLKMKASQQQLESSKNSINLGKPSGRIADAQSEAAQELRPRNSKSSQFYDNQALTLIQEEDATLNATGSQQLPPDHCASAPLSDSLRGAEASRSSADRFPVGVIQDQKSASSGLSDQRSRDFDRNQVVAVNTALRKGIMKDKTSVCLSDTSIAQTSDTKPEERKRLDRIDEEEQSVLSQPHDECWTPQQRKLLKKCARLLQPLKLNPIWKRLMSDSPTELQNQVFSAISRLAFEKNPHRQIKVVQLDYYSLESSFGSLTFSDGMSVLVFRGKQISEKEFKRQSTRQEEQKGLLSRFMQLFGKLKINTQVDDYIKMNTILGILYGPHSISFKQYMRLQQINEEVQRHKFDQWRYITVLTPMRSYDFIFSKIKDSLDFIVAIHEAMARQAQSDFQRKHDQSFLREASFAEGEDVESAILDDNISRASKKKYNKTEDEVEYKQLLRQLRFNTIRRRLKFEMYRRKIECIALENGYSIGQLFALAIYSAVDDWNEEQIGIDIKLEALKKVQNIIFDSPQLSDISESIDTKNMRKLQRIVNIQRLENISKLSEKNQEQALSQYFEDFRSMSMSITLDPRVRVIKNDESVSDSNSNQLDSKLSRDEKRMKVLLASLSSSSQILEKSQVNNIGAVRTPTQNFTSQLNHIMEIEGQTPSMNKVLSEQTPVNYSLRRNSIQQDAQAVWQEWVKQKEYNKKINKKEKVQNLKLERAAFFKKVRALRYLEHIQNKKMNNELQKRRSLLVQRTESWRSRKFKSQQAALARGAADGGQEQKFFIIDWARALNIKQRLDSPLNGTQNRQIIDETELMKTVKETVKWTQKLYHKDRFLDQLDEPSQHTSLCTNEAALKQLEAEPTFQILARQRERDSKLNRLAFSGTSDFATVVARLSYRKREQQEQDRVRRQRSLQTKNMTIKQILEKQSINAKRAKAEWRQEMRRQQLLLKKEILMELELKQQQNLQPVQILQHKPRTTTNFSQTPIQ